MTISSVSNWLISNILWEVLIVLLITVIATYNSFKISKFLLKGNRDTRGNGRGTHFADRFIDAWKSPQGLVSSQINYQDPCQTQSRWKVDVIDKKLQENKLVIMKDSKIYPVKNLRNKLIIKILKFCLIHIFDDNKSEYNKV